MNPRTRRWLRRGTSALIVLVLVGIGLIAAPRLRHRSPAVAALESEAVGGTSDDPVQGIYTGFKYVETLAGQVVFILNSVRTLGKTSGWHEIEDVRLELFRQGERGPLLTCEGARFNIETRDAELRGPILVEFPDGAILNTRTARFVAASRTLSSESSVMFTNRDWIGRAERAEYSLADDRLELIEGAISTGDGITVDAPLIRYLRKEARMELPLGCRVRSGPSLVTAGRADVELAGSEGPAQRVVLGGGVTGRAEYGPSQGIVEITAALVTAERDVDGNWQIAATTDGPWIAVALWDGPGFVNRTMLTQELRGAVAPAGVLNLRALDGVCLREIPIEGDPRRGQAGTARIWFADGQASDVELADDVVLFGDGFEARGQRVRMSAAAGTILLQSDPSGRQRTLLTSERGQIACDRIELFDREDRATAHGDVQGRLDGVLLLGAEQDAAPTPVHFAAESLEVLDRAETLRLAGTARVWQGHRLLLADQVVYRQDGSEVHASGHVRTTLPAVELDPQARPGDDVMVVAKSLDYDRAEQHALYRGNVRYSDHVHTLAANELDIAFDASNRVTSVEAVGAVELVDLATGRKMTGQRARRAVATQVVQVTGSPVQVTDPDGTVIASSSLTWDQASGSVTFAGGTETIYYPEETP